MKKKDKIAKLTTPTARKEAAGYRILSTCAGCANCKRQYLPHRVVEATCGLYDFTINLDRGVCEHFDHVGKYRGGEA